MENTEHTDVKDLVVLLDLTQTEKDLRDAELRHRDIVHDVTTPKGMKAARADVAELRSMRTTVDKKRLEAGRVLLGMKKINDDQAKAIIERISALEDPIKAQIEMEEARKERERLEALEREQARVDAHRARIAAWRNLPGDIAGRPLAGMRLARERLKQEGAQSFDGFEEFTQEAADAYHACVSRVDELIAQAEAAEREAERVRQQEAELAAMRERNAQLEREAAEAREREERRQREAEQAERDRVAAAEREERERLEAIARAEREAEQERQRAAQEAEHKRLEAEAAEQRARAEQAERQRREEAAKAEEERQASLTMRVAMQALVDHCIARGMGHDQPVQDAMGVLMNTEGDVPQVKGKRQASKPAKVAR